MSRSSGKERLLAKPARGVPLDALTPGTRGRVVRILRTLGSRADRLAVLGVTPGATVRVLQRFPGIVFECDQTELAIERAVARVILVVVDEKDCSSVG